MRRRDFFKVVGTSTAAAALGGCEQTANKLLPLVVPNENIVPGVATWFSTTCRECPSGCGVIARNREGRVVKLEGNPDHPVNEGALCIRGQAALQSLYHPDRFAGPQRREGAALKSASWDDALKLVADKIAQLRGAGKGRAIALVSRLENGAPAVFLDRWTQAVGARPRLAYEPFAYESLRAANRVVFGRDAIPYYAFEEAEVVLSFGADWVETWLSNVAYPRGFAKMHGFRYGRAGTVIHVEPRRSLTASVADEWVRNAPGTEGVLAQAILKSLIDDGAADRRFAEAVAGVDLNKAVETTGVGVATIRRLAQVFGRAKPALAIGGGVASTGTNATQTLVAVNLLNAAVGAIGKTVRFGPDAAYAKVSPHADVVQLVDAMAKGEVELLLLANGVDPVFTLPGGLKFADAARKVGLIVSFANQPNETTALAHVILPDTHWLESWGEYAPREGVTGLMQPTMSPVRDALPMADALLRIGRAVLGSEEGKGPLPWPSYADFVKGGWQAQLKDGWTAALSRGVIGKDAAPVSVTARPTALTIDPVTLDGDADGFVLLAYPSLRFYDGRSAGSAWLHEAPDPMTQAAWDAWVEVPAEAAAKLGVGNGDVVRVTSPHGAIELPAYVSQSLHPKAVAIPIGHRYAPYHARYVAAPSTSLNPVSLLGPAIDAQSGGAAYLGVRVTLAKTGTRRPLAILQATHDQDEREIARHVDLGAAREQALRGRPKDEPELPSMYPPHPYPGYRWGMVVDTDLCVGCSACLVACQAENNVGVVGKAQAAYGRQMHWLRVERWAEDGHTSFMPMFCQHCEVAPCEPVCPVFASYRTDEGLNGQIYNRCVGTRYCGNNCPYHVRRFNWFQWAVPAPLDVQLNPDVTVRQHGVMEKCTMCIQRIIAGKDHARDANRTVRDGDIQTACQQTCPTQAIVFGNLKDDGAAVTKLARSPRAYDVLGELGTRPSVRYLKKVTRSHAG
jgi:molybdopterin-containing oxidoreductase family iron-sulfur binding subunit